MILSKPSRNEVIARVVNEPVLFTDQFLRFLEDVVLESERIDKIKDTVTGLPVTASATYDQVQQQAILDALNAINGV